MGLWTTHTHREVGRYRDIQTERDREGNAKRPQQCSKLRKVASGFPTKGLFQGYTQEITGTLAASSREEPWAGLAESLLN